MPNRFLGQETVKIVVGDREESGKLLTYQSPSTFEVHKHLLCYHSRFFNAKLSRPLDTIVLTEALLEVEKRQGEIKISKSHEGTSLLQPDDVPAGYVPSWITYAEEYRKGSTAASIHSDIYGTPTTKRTYNTTGGRS